jgi:hypothetical protein
LKTAQALEEIVPALPLVERYIAALFQARLVLKKVPSID